MTVTRFFWLPIALLALLLAPGCALFKPVSTGVDSGNAEKVDPSVVVPPAQTTAVSEASAAVPGPVLAPVVEAVEVDTLDRKDLKPPSKIVIRLPYADVVLSTAASLRKGYLRVAKTAGEPNCKVRIFESDKGLEISEPSKPVAAVSALAKVKSALPSVSGCRFNIDIGLRDAASAAIDLTRGSLAVEEWSAPLEVKIEWGDIDVGTVGALNVTCGRCTLSGEGVEGPLAYTLERGNVGLAGLGGSVVGTTFGDTVLKWRRLKSDSSVKLISHAGDVILFFPDLVPLAINLKAPRGDVSSLFHTGSNGVPVTVSAELGNVRVYRAGKEARKSK